MAWWYFPGVFAFTRHERRGRPLARKPPQRSWHIQRLPRPPTSNQTYREITTKEREREKDQEKERPRERERQRERQKRSEEDIARRPKDTETPTRRRCTDRRTHAQKPSRFVGFLDTHLTRVGDSRKRRRGTRNEKDKTRNRSKIGPEPQPRLFWIRRPDGAASGPIHRVRHDHFGSCSFLFPFWFSMFWLAFIWVLLGFTVFFFSMSY